MREPDRWVSARNWKIGKSCKCTAGPLMDPDSGDCIRCGHTFLPRCPKTGVVIPSCSCYRCQKELIYRHAA